jgi:hypothetical protein
MRCPFCESADVEIVSPWAGQIITCQARCRSCNTYFEAIREEFEESGSSPDSQRQPKGRIPLRELGSLPTA